eukprot:6698617-Ditylum_brightwellii.AAC.1
MNVSSHPLTDDINISHILEVEGKNSSNSISNVPPEKEQCDGSEYEDDLQDTEEEEEADGDDDSVDSIDQRIRYRSIPSPPAITEDNDHVSSCSTETEEEEEYQYLNDTEDDDDYFDVAPTPE